MSSWKTVPLGDVVEETQYGTSLKANEGGVGVPVLRMNNITYTGSLDLTDVKHVQMPHEDIEQYSVRRGDLLFNRTNSQELVGKMGVWDRDDQFAFAGYLIRMRLKPDRADPQFVGAWFNTPEMKALLRTRAKPSISMSNINAKEALKFPLVLPPLAEQRRIAEVLDRAEALRSKRRAGLAQLDSLTQSLFLEVFGEKLDSPPIDITVKRARVPARCTWKLLTDVARLATGHTPDRERNDYWNGEIPWISLTDIRSLDGSQAAYTLQNVTPLGIENSSSVLLPKGTVCFSRTASVGFVTVMGREMATSQDFMNWVCGPNVDPTFLMWALIMSRQRLLALSSGSTHRTIYMRVVEQFRVLLPPIHLQREFARQVVAVEKLKAAQRASLAELDALFASLQHRAFRGEL